MLTRHLRLGVLVLAAAVSAGCYVEANAISYTGTFERTLGVTGPVELEVQTGSGSIQIHRGADSQVRIVGRIRANSFWDGWSAEERVKRIEAQPPVLQRGNVIEIGKFTSLELGQNVSISYDVTVPENTQVRSRTGSGSHSIDSIRGPVEARTGSGSIRVGEIQGEVTATTGSGSIQVRSARDGEFRTGSGSINVQELNGRLRAHTGSGSVSVDGNPSKDWVIHTGSGGIMLKLPSTAAFDLDARSNGTVRVNHPLETRGYLSKRHVEGRVRGGGPLVRVSAGSGSIRVD